MEILGTATRRYPLVVPCLLAATLAVSAAGAAEPPQPRTRGGDRAASDQARQLVAKAQALEHGEGVARDPEQAAALYCQASRLGDPAAMYALGWMYANGRGLERHDGYAGTLFAMAASLGDPHARRMTRFTGAYTGEVPDCLHPRRRASVRVVDASWNPDDHIRALPADRQKVARLVIELAESYGIEPRLALAIAIAESNLNPIAVSPKNAMGVMQLIPGTAARFNVRNPFDPGENIRGGLAYLRWLLAYFGGDVALAAAGYNAGEGAVERHRGVPPYKETRAYVERILAYVGRSDHPFDSAVAAPSAVLSTIRMARPPGSDR